MPLKLQIAVSWASLIFQKRFPDAVNTEGRSYIASTACSRSHKATTKPKIIISKIREKKCPLKQSYVAPRGTEKWAANDQEPFPIARVVAHPLLTLREREVLGSNPGRAIPKALKMVPVATLLGAQHYKASTGFFSPNK